MKKEKWLAYTLFIAYSMTLLLNYLTATGYLTGHSQKDISNHFHTLITPSSAAFSIWSVIYFLLLVIIVKAYLTKEATYLEKLKAIYPFVMGTFLFNALWVISFTSHQIGLSTLLISLYTVFLLIILIFLKQLENKLSLLSMSFGIHFGWLLIATLVNWTIFFQKINLEQPVISTILLAIILVLLSIFVIWLANKITNPFVLPPLSWAFYFIFTENQLGPVHLAKITIGFLALALAILIALTFSYMMIQSLRKQHY
ncbi:tryptophan-rich sensory protein [Streptococcus iniae]|uniref:tryptophan-rich sensory protein n=1 Tax=Streptococcus iniae TaxID=1346 RepID=UPI0008D9D9E5|nr:TspO/MBR family protein [Streptococcus iniae]OHX27758.1 tryptophan-rich sensory protein [Streptococcus iniae]RLV26927.1 tryptophan-rich sensory protein [Streptococcus iniae]